MKLLAKYFFLQALIALILYSSLSAQKIPLGGYTVREFDSLQRLSLRPQMGVYQHKAVLPTSDYSTKYQGANIKSSNTLKQLKQNTTCFSSSGRYFLSKDSVSFGHGDPYKMADGNLLIPSEYSDYSTNNQRGGGSLIKCDENGNLLWFKHYDTLGGSSHISYSRVIDLQDGSILLAGASVNRVSGNYELIITKTDNTGNIIWSKVFKSRVWGPGSGSSDYYYVQQMKQDPYTGEIYLTGPHWTQGNSIIKLNQTTGDIIWSNLYHAGWGTYFDSPFGIDILPNEVRLFGRISGSVYPYNYVSVYRINKSTGDTIQTKFFSVLDTPARKLSFSKPEPLKKLSNGNYAISGTCNGNFEYMYNGVTPLYQAAVLEIDSNLNFVKAYCIRNNIEPHPSNTVTTMFPDGSGIFSMLRYFGGYTGDIYFVQFKNGNILKKRKRTYIGELMDWTNEPVKTSTNGDLWVRRVAGATNAQKIEFLQLHTSDTSSACLGVDETNSFIQPFNYTVSNYIMDSIGYNDFIPSVNKTLETSNTTMIFTPDCVATSFCDTIKMIASANTLCISQPLFLTLRKNSECGASVLFNYNPAGIRSFAQINDSTYKVEFNSVWQGYMYAGIQGCVTLLDSVYITVILSPGNVNLGTDIALCPENTITLNAHAGFSMYRWSTGATDSTIAIKLPGIYYVDVIDRCGNKSSDTIEVVAAPLRECFKEFYIPLAFTPNNDTKNDIFKPQIFGNVSSYNFIVLNRYGKVVFITTNPANGWDGRVEGKNVDNGTYVWICSFQLNGLPLIREKGAVVLIR